MPATRSAVDVEAHVQVDGPFDNSIAQCRVDAIPTRTRSKRDVVLGPRIEDLTGAIRGAFRFSITTRVLRTQPERIRISYTPVFGSV